MEHWIIIGLGGLLGLIALVVIYDLLQTKHTILRNFPLVGHFRYWLETIGPELRQYIVTNNDEERPFSRDQRRWVYSSSKKQNNYFGFGSDNNFEEASNYPIIRQSAFPLEDPQPGESHYDPKHAIECAKVLGEWTGRKKAFRPSSVINISAMSYGSLSKNAVEAINRGCAIAGCMQNAGEGGISEHHLHQGELIWQIGTSYFGSRDNVGRFELNTLVEKVERIPVKAIELKLSQGAKPGRGGLLPAAKVTAEIAKIRGIPEDKDCVSPASHREFSNVREMIAFIEKIADATGLPVGIKSSVGQFEFWKELADEMKATQQGPDFINIDGGEGGTGAAPLVFTDHVAYPFLRAFSSVYRIFAERQMQHCVVFSGAGKLGFPQTAITAFALGCDMISVGREAMLSIGCIQAQRCHTGHCPTGIATQSPWLSRGLVPTSKALRLANYVIALRKEILWLCRACGVRHPSLITPDHIEMLEDNYRGTSLTDMVGYKNEWFLPVSQVPPDEILHSIGKKGSNPLH